MNRRFYIICIAAILALVGPALANSTSTVHGSVYRWDTFKPLENAVVEVNSTPSQSMVARYGVYSFDLVPGDYNVTAYYYQNNSVIYSATEIIKIKDQGNYVRDLLLFPVYSDELMSSSENQSKSTENSSNSIIDTAVSDIESSKDGSNNTNSVDSNSAGFINAPYLLITVFLFLILLGGYHISRRNKKIKENQPQKMVYINGKGHIVTEPSKYVKVSELPVEVSDQINIPSKDIKPEIKQESQEKELVKFFEAVSELEERAEPANEPIKGLGEEPVKETEKEMLLNEITPEIAEKEIPVEPVEIKEPSPAKEKELGESKSQTDKEETLIEKSGDEPTESSKIESSDSIKKLPLPADLQEVMDIIRGQGGRITQKDLRSKLKYSEGKVSLMLADLERRELVEKFKRGRGNVVIIRDEQR